MLDDLKPHQPSRDQHGPAEKNPQHRQMRVCRIGVTRKGLLLKRKENPIASIIGVMGELWALDPFAFAAGAVGDEENARRFTARTVSSLGET